MENDAPVVGPDAPTVNSKMVKLDIATADWSRPTSGRRVIQEQFGCGHFGGTATFRPVSISALPLGNVAENERGCLSRAK